MASSIFSPVHYSTFHQTHHLPAVFLLTPPPALLLSKKNKYNSPRKKLLAVRHALAESDSPKFLEDETLPLLQEIADSLVLPPDYFAQLPSDLRLDLNDAAFDLANGPVIDECGQELGEMLLNLSEAWEKADALTSIDLGSKLPLLHGSLTESAKSAFGKRLVSAGRRFESMGQYGQGELQRIAKAMIKAGKFLSASPVIIKDEQLKEEPRMLKFGDLQVALTPRRANIGAVIAFAFGILSWELSQGIQSTPESSLQYAKSLRGTLLGICYSSTVLSAFACVGLILLARQLASEG